MSTFSYEILLINIFQLLKHGIKFTPKYMISKIGRKYENKIPNNNADRPASHKFRKTLNKNNLNFNK